MSSHTDTSNNNSLLYLEHILKKLLHQLFIIFIIIGAISLAASLIRIIEFGWMLQHTLHIFLYCTLIFVYILLQKHSSKTITLFMFPLIGCIAVLFLTMLGMLSTGLLILLYVCIMITTFIGFNAGLITLGIMTLIISIIAIAFSTHMLSVHYNANQYMTSWSAWATQISTFVLLLTTAIKSTALIKKHLLNSLNDLNIQTQRLAKMNDELLQSKNKIAAIIRTAPEAIITITLEGTITTCNEQAHLLLQYGSPDELIKKDFFTLLSPESIPAIKDILSESLQSNTLFRDIEFELITSSGKKVPVKMSLAILHDNNKTPTEYLTIIQDITRSKDFEEYICQSEKMEAIGQMAGGIAHDFNNQLTGIKGCAEVLKIHLKNDPNNIPEVLSILKTVDKASSLTEQLLSFSRKGINQSLSFDLHQILNETHHILERTLDSSIRVICNTNAKRSMIHGDPTQIQSVLLNLVLNARDAMPDGGSVTITTSNRIGAEVVNFFPFFHKKQKPYLVISVKDTGTGMDEEVQRHIFEPFFTTKAPGKGTGMGLANVYNTISNHNGIIEVRSTLGKGTEFKIFLPEYHSE